MRVTTSSRGRGSINQSRYSGSSKCSAHPVRVRSGLEEPRQAIEGHLQTLEDVVVQLFPDASRSLQTFSDTPVLPADIFAFAGLVLNSSGAYHHISPLNGPSSRGRHMGVSDAMRARAVATGASWRQSPARRGSLPKIPRRVQTLWESLKGYSADVVQKPLERDEGIPGWWTIVLELMMIADEASRGVGFDSSSIFFRPILDAFTGADLISGEEFRRIQAAPATISTADPAIVCVQPKSRTPAVGCTMRSLTHNLALLPGQGEVSARWVVSPFDTPSESPDRLGLLLVPFPYTVMPDSFVGGGDPTGRWGWFDMDQKWLPREGPEREQFGAFILSLVQDARAKGDRVDGVVLPELSLDYTLFRWLANLLAKEGQVDFLIAGVSSDRDGRSGNFVAIAPFFLFDEQTDRGSQWDQSFLIREKHHRWKLTSDQIKAYDIENALSVDRNWWEHLDLLNRSLDLFVYRGGTSLTTLICEDLARVDPCQAVLRAIGPNLVIALLMDGPQLEGRWPARYATVLADDPGSSVLTFTSLGLIERQNALQRFPQSSAIALWKDEANGIRRLELPRYADALCLQLKADNKTEHTLDGRSDDAYAHRWVFEKYDPVTASVKPAWIFR